MVPLNLGMNGLELGQINLLHPLGALLRRGYATQDYSAIAGIYELDIMPRFYAKGVENRDREHNFTIRVDSYNRGFRGHPLPPSLF